MSIYNIITQAIHDRENDSIRFSPKKALGQHFLTNTTIARAIVDLLPNDIMTLEIGPGRGALTRYLQERVSYLYLIERDPYWATIHSKTTTTICADALHFDYELLHASRGTMWQCISNLPYNIASPLIWDIIAKAQCYCVFMVQKEVGERLIAKEHTKAYGILSVWVQSFCIPKKEYIIPPSAFFPAPNVDSMVLSFTPRSIEERERIPPHFAHFLHYSFTHRRKQLLPILQRRFPHIRDIFDRYDLPYTVRAEELSVHELQDIARTLYEV